ncbi:unnamed protein product [Peniophora sp. CBMAI 1063]|nr:unnamed protein product [Peniophora sp. CBMAI 1063]
MKMSLSVKLAALAQSLFVLAALATPNPIAGTSNIAVRDPAIWHNSDNGKYYLFATDGNIGTWTSTSLAGPYTYVGAVLPDCSSINLSGNCDLWAPDVNYYDGQYVLYYSVSTIGSQNSAIGVATSSSMDPGTWTDHGEVISSAAGDVYNAIDPNLIDWNGLKLSFGSYWQGMYQIGLWPDVATQASALPGTHLAGGNGRAAEGGFTYKSAASDYYFFFFSAGITPLSGSSSRPAAGDEYKVLVGRGAGGMGPYYDANGAELTADNAGTLVLGSHDNVYAPGGQSVFLDPISDRDVIVYHYELYDGAIGGPSYLGINYLDFSSGWPVVVS